VIANMAAGADARAEKLTCTVLFCEPAVETVHMKIRRLILMIVLIIIYLLDIFLHLETDEKD
jgi:hypothetical protein